MIVANEKALTTSYTKNHNGLAKCACTRSLSFFATEYSLNIRHRELVIIR